MVLGALVVYLATTLYLTSTSARLAVIFVLVAAAVAHSAVGAIQFKQTDEFMLLPGILRPAYYWRASGFYICPNHLAGLLQMTGLMLLSVVCWAPMKTGLRALCAYAGLMCLAGLALTGSRGGYLSVLFGLFVFAMLSTWAVRGVRPERALKMLVLVLLAAAVVVGAGLLIMLNSEQLSARLGQIYDPTNMRLFMWQAALKQFALDPIFGTGSGTYVFFGRFFRSPQVQADPIHVHCDYLELLAEYGLIGATLAAMFLVVHFFGGLRGIKAIVASQLRPARQLASADAALLIGALSGMSALLLHSVVDFNFHIPANTLVAAFLFGIMASPRETPVGHETPAIPRAYRWLAPGIAAVLLFVSARLFPGEYFGEKARVALREKKFSESMGLAEQALTYERKNPDLFFYLGEARMLLSFQTRDPVESPLLVERAVTDFQQGLELFPRDTRLLLKLGQALDIAGRADEAGPIYERAIANDPNFGNPYAYYGLHWKLLRQFGEAEHNFLKAQSLGEWEISRPGLKNMEELSKENLADWLMKMDAADKRETPASATPP
jgi:O-antigen ligase